MEATIIGIEVGTITTCQIGRPEDSFGYEEHVPVVVLAVTGEKILAKKLGSNLLCAAIVPWNQVAGRIYATRASMFDDSFKMSEARRSLGF